MFHTLFLHLKRKKTNFGNMTEIINPNIEYY